MIRLEQLRRTNIFVAALFIGTKHVKQSKYQPSRMELRSYEKE